MVINQGFINDFFFVFEFLSRIKKRKKTLLNPCYRRCTNESNFTRAMRPEQSLLQSKELVVLFFLYATLICTNTTSTNSVKLEEVTGL